jgi:hypothetical protein
MKIIDFILSSVSKIEDIVKVVQAVLAGFEAFTTHLKGNSSNPQK